MSSPPSDEVHALVAAFRLLPTNNSRRDAVEALVDELTPYEWRTLRNITAARSFQLDIVGQLPVELVAHIFACLDTCAPYYLQRVSPQWRHVLQSPMVLKSSLYSWSSRAVDLQETDYSLCELRAKQVQAFRQGLPKRYFSIETHEPHCHVILVEDTLIWSCLTLPDSQARVIYVLDIKSWSLQKLQGDARETVHCLFASDQLVGFASKNNVCYVWALDGREKQKFRVPNTALFHSVTCRDNTVACAGCLDDHALVYIWNYDTRRGTSFNIGFDTHLFANSVPRCDHRHGLALLLQPKDGHIIVFADERCSIHKHNDIGSTSAYKQTVTIRYCRYTYAGQCVSASNVMLQDLPTPLTHLLRNDFTPVNRRGVFRISLYGACLQFDEQLFAFTKVRPTMEGDQVWASPSLFWWNDVFFQGMYAPDWPSSSGSYPVLAHIGTGTKVTCNPLVRQCRITESQVNIGGFMNTDGHDMVLLNDKYVVRALHRDLQISCFQDGQERTFTDAKLFGIGSSMEFDMKEHMRWLRCDD